MNKPRIYGVAMLGMLSIALFARCTSYESQCALNPLVCDPVKKACATQEECDDQNGCTEDTCTDGSCNYQPRTGTACGAEATCSDDGASVPEEQCNEQGACTRGPNIPCHPYTCDTVAKACSTTCSTHGGCAADAFCSNSQCLNKLAQGASCSEDVACASGYCIDDVCCNNACNGTCRTCDANGTCSDVAPGTDPEFECDGSSVCGGDKTCKYPNGDPCQSGDECTTGFCTDDDTGIVGICCESSCVGSCHSCRFSLTGQSPGTCSACLDCGNCP